MQVSCLRHKFSVYSSVPVECMSRPGLLEMLVTFGDSTVVPARLHDAHLAGALTSLTSSRHRKRHPASNNSTAPNHHHARADSDPGNYREDSGACASHHPRECDGILREDEEAAPGLDTAEAASRKAVSEFPFTESFGKWK